MIEKLKEVWFIPKQYKEEMNREMYQGNAARMSIIFVAAALYLTFIFMDGLIRLSSDSEFMATIVIKAFFIVASIGAAITLFRLRKSNKIRMISTIIHIIALFFLILGATNSFVVQELMPSITIFLITIMLSAMVIRMRPINAVLIYSTAFIYFYIGLPYFQTNKDYVHWDYLNAGISIMIGLLSNMLLYHHTYLLVKDRLRIESQNEELRFLSEHDMLTGFYNHQSIHQLVDEYQEKALKEKRQLSVAVIDIDDFKKVNDTYGHKIGDHVIRMVAYNIKEATRLDDVHGRYGGDEFVVIMPDMNRSDAADMLKALRRIDMNDNGVDMTVTLSIGVVELSEDNEACLVESADFKMYDSKYKGKSQISY